MTKHILLLFNRFISTPLKNTYLYHSMISPIYIWLGYKYNALKLIMIPKPNPHPLFSRLTQTLIDAQVSEIKQIKTLVTTNSDNSNMKIVRDVMRKNLKNDTQNLQELRKLRQQIYYSQNFDTEEGLKALIEIDAKLYLHYKQLGLTKQTKQQLDLSLIWINKFKLRYPEDAQIKQFQLNELSCLYQKANILKSEKDKTQYIKVLQRIYKLQLDQQESPEKKKRCHRILRKICLNFLVIKDVNSMMEYYLKAQSDSERRIVRHYLADLTH